MRTIYLHEETTIEVPEGWVQIAPGTVIQPEDKFWSEGKGPWVAFNSEESKQDGCDEEIGIQLLSSMHPVIRKEKAEL